MKLGTTILLFLALQSGVKAKISGNQNSGDTLRHEELSRIRWVTMFPSDKKADQKKNLLGRVSEFIFGPKPVVIAKPMAIAANSPDDYFVLDQKTMAVVSVEEQKAKKLNPKTKLEFPPASIVDLCRIPGQGFWVTDSKTGRIYRVSEDGKQASVLNPDSVFNQPTGIAYHAPSKTVWVLETKAHRVLVLDLDGNRLKTIGVRGTRPGEFNYPTHIWIDDKGLVYIVDSMNYRVQILDENGGWLSMFGQVGDGTGSFARPKGVATDSHGNIYVVDALFHTVQIFNKEGRFLYNFGSQGREAGDFWMPNGIYIDSNDYIYVADTYNARVQVFQLINN